MAPPTGLGGWTGNNAIDSYEKLGLGQFLNYNFIFFVSILTKQVLLSSLNLIHNFKFRK